jgi:hypothetical protein
MSHEALWVDRWLYGLLTGDSTLVGLVDGRVYGYLDQRDGALPYVVYSFQGGYDVRGNGPTRFMTSLLYQVKAVGAGASFQPLQAIADRLDELLQGASGTVSGGRVLVCVREQPINFPEVHNGVIYLHVGGLWRIHAQAV